MGERGLLIAIIATATEDLNGDLGQRIDALFFFASDFYKSILSLLNLPADWLPMDLKKEIGL